MKYLVCPYCDEDFNETSHVPLMLECKHTFCRNCVDELKLFLTVCPFDGLRVNYSLSLENEEVLIRLKNSCKLHLLPIIAYCCNHLSVMCEACLSTHNQCKISSGEISELQARLANECEDFLSVVYEIEDKIAGMNIYELDKTLELCDDDIRKIQISLKKLLQSYCDSANRVKFLKKSTKLLKTNTFQNLKRIKELISELLVPEKMSMNVNQHLNFDKMLENLNKLLFKNESSTSKEYDQLKDCMSCLINYFQQFTEVNSHDNYSVFMLNFWHLGPQILPINVIGFGNPIDPEGWIILHSLVLYIDDQIVWSIKDIFIKRENELLCHFLIIPFIILFQSGNKMFIHIEMQGTSSYCFHLQNLHKYINITAVDGNTFYGHFPVLYLGYVIDTNNLSKFKLK